MRQRRAGPNRALAFCGTSEGFHPIQRSSFAGTPCRTRRIKMREGNRETRRLNAVSYSVIGYRPGLCPIARNVSRRARPDDHTRTLASCGTQSVLR